uniref:ATP synthase complex subunit 8 n=1 Tax=Craugastor augusti TaxID=228429 RepID=S4V1P3_9NEOB|nr:ATP synthase F0 subunit 8 [Craugastor augusti]
MPQLNIMPWFLVFSSSWFFTLIFTPSKITPHFYMNAPQPSPNKTPTKPWSWPWL